MFEVTPDSLEMSVNRGSVYDTGDFLAFQKVARVRASMKAVSRGLDAIESEAATFQVSEVLLRPIIDQRHALQPVADRIGADVVGELLAGIEVIDREVLEKHEVDEAANAAEAADVADVDLRLRRQDLESVATELAARNGCQACYSDVLSLPEYDGHVLLPSGCMCGSGHSVTAYAAGVCATEGGAA